MARAFLEIENELKDAFYSAQENTRIRGLKISISNDIIKLESTIECYESPEYDFENSLLLSLSDTEARLITFCIADRMSGCTPKWVLIAWVPDSCPVRDKMLYSSSREDLKKSLGLGYFVGEYYANTKSDMTWSQINEYISKDRVDVPLSLGEKLVLEEKTLTHVESNVTRSTAMGALPFHLSSSIISALDKLEKGEVNWVEMTLNSSEEIDLVHEKVVDTNSTLQAHISSTDARFIAIRLSKSSSSCFVFLFSCPENTPVRMRMSMSSCKASVLAACSSKGISFDRSIEIRSSDEIDDHLQLEREDTTTAATSGPSSASAVMTHSKPQRPGRGKARIAKFTL
mmetsp:Transcript_6225/g.9388  ORF Transcript_6225/g.9388 Transcript_6225/m.9388 type:complete len:343 (+) Transcript_6225:92-1120(+)|eukprot:CAMPEP_0185028136 /NCGR_PEP_ID=MMETSP1103-20130426/13703_1 /TAXON_ID=36769 /ORGANISM="Paraphysomonas bandaiensis, Strain Caron Lab Isolate" /LENGTH=342 /DNA_ID=CAMNT_0027562445 /DNA_START=16 /DNA_END=1044 /DNA_ORIENTATION=-